MPCKEAGQRPREGVVPQATPRQEPTSDSPSSHSSKVVSQPQSCQVDNPPWLETVTRPVLDFPETNLLDDLSLVRHQCSPNILACRITHFYQNWEKLTKNPWVLQQVMGHKIEFHSEPFQSHQPVTECSQQEAPLMQREIKLLLAKGAIIPITQPPAEQGFISTVFLVPKKDGGARPVINLRALNHFISSQHFKMEGVHLLKNLIQSGGPQGCLFYSTHPSDSPKVPKVHMEARDLSIHMPPVRPQFSPTSIHQAHETGEWLSSKQRSKECGVYRRHTADSTISRTPQTTHTCNLEFVSSTRVPSKLPKVPADPYSEHNIPGVCSGLSNGRTQPPKFQGQEYSEGSSAPPYTTFDYSTSTGTIHWKTVSSDPGSPPSPTSLTEAYSSSNTMHLHCEATTSRWPYHRRQRRT